MADPRSIRARSPAIPFALLAAALVGCGRDAARTASAPAAESATDATVEPTYRNLGIPLVAGGPDLSQVRISLERTRCWGSCPEYVVTLRGDGSGKYVGSRVVEHELTVSPEDFRRLLGLFDAADFFSIDHTDTWTIYDAPWATLTLEVAGRTKLFGNRWINFEGLEERHAAFHESMDAIAKAIDDAVRIERFIGTEAERAEPFGPRDASSGGAVDGLSAPDEPRRVPATPPLSKLGIPIVDGESELSQVEIVLERTKCLGWCPSYVVSLRGDRTGTYQGRSYVKTDGTHKLTVSPDDLLWLLRLFDEADFFSIDHKDTFKITDVPSTFVTLRVGARTKRVENRWNGVEGSDGRDTVFHRSLADLASAIDNAVGIESWIGTVPERQALFHPERKRR